MATKVELFKEIDDWGVIHREYFVKLFPEIMSRQRYINWVTDIKDDYNTLRAAHKFLHTGKFALLMEELKSLFKDISIETYLTRKILGGKQLPEVIAVTAIIYDLKVAWRTRPKGTRKK